MCSQNTQNFMLQRHSVPTLNTCFATLSYLVLSFLVETRPKGQCTISQLMAWGGRGSRESWFKTVSRILVTTHGHQCQSQGEQSLLELSTQNPWDALWFSRVSASFQLKTLQGKQRFLFPSPNRKLNSNFPM